MSDSETDLLPNNMLTFQNHGTTICAKGPNINSTNISSFSFRNNVMTSTMNMPWNMERPRYAESVCDQRSASYRREREVSPMSFHSASGMQPRNFHHSYYPGGMSSHRSVYSRRSGSPMSVRTIDSNTSMSARDIAFAFKNGHFNKLDFEIIKEAYHKFLKGRVRRRVEKKRNLRMFMKGFRRKSGGDSGDQASDSSISSDDCRSTRTSRSAFYKENTSSCRSTRTDLSDFRRTMKESNMFRDCTDSFRKNSFKSVLSQRPPSVKDINSAQNQQNTTVAAQKDRFKSGFLLPSQRFNQSVASMSIPEKPESIQRANENEFAGNSKQNDKPVRNPASDSEQDEIFGEVTVMEKTSHNRSAKRNLDDVVPVPDKKRSKLSSPQNSNSKQKTPNLKINAKQKSKDFVFAKPKLPIKKPVSVNHQKNLLKSTSQQLEKPVSNSQPVPTNRILHTPEPKTKSSKDVPEHPVEKVLASSQQLAEKFIKKSSQTSEIVPNPVTTLSQDTAHEKDPCPNVEHSTTDMSMRPSFIKRKLFSQKVDVAEKNSSKDNLQIDSPQTNIYSKIQKEKNKARKLVTTQSCLSRDVADDSNLLDLIHKIVPPDRMNMTTATNRSEIQNNKSKPANADKFDITSIVPVCNDGDMSDTYTDEEIFGADENEKQKRQSQIIEDKPQTVEKEVQEHVNNNQNRTVAKQKNRNEVLKPPKVIGEKICNEIIPDKQQALTKSICRVLLEKVHTDQIKNVAPVKQPLSPPENNGLKRNVYKCVKSFWDTDVESDFEATPLMIAAPIEKGTPVIKASTKITANKKSSIKTTAPVPKEITTQIASTKATLNEANSNKKDKINKTVCGSVNKTLKESQKDLNLTKPITLNKNKSMAKVLNNSIQSKNKTHLSGKENETTKKNKACVKNNESDTAVTNQKVKRKVSPPRKTNTAIKSKTNANSTILKVLNNTMRIRAQRKPKINKCCEEPDKSELSINDTLCKTLRSRKVDLSSSMKSENSNTSVAKKTVKTKSKTVKRKNIHIYNNNKDKSIPSDISFTLASETPPSGKPATRAKKSIAYFNTTQRVTRRSDVSFTLSPDMMNLNTTMRTRNSLKRNREIESLQLSLFPKTGKTRH
ncbi:uncharacterized protein LOC126374295 [Pectinophora gossypiella]|nr:uncharacterized protein LOC126374295 [Pectinophora gossypiella]